MPKIRDPGREVKDKESGVCNYKNNKEIGYHLGVLPTCCLFTSPLFHLRRTAFINHTGLDNNYPPHDPYG